MNKSKTFQKPIIVGITGGIGSGKTTICRVFEWLKVPVYYADDAAKKLINENLEVRHAIEELLGKKAYNTQGYDRNFVGKLVFKDRKLLLRLNAIVHPAVAKDFEQWITLHQKEPYLLKEAAILFESGSYKDCDKIICVVAPEEMRIKRVINRSGISRKEIKKRIDSQWSDAKKVKLSDFVIHNDETKALIGQVLEINHAIKNS